ncbi:hypothetical protein D3C72_2015380 [compost metagenome]
MVKRPVSSQMTSSHPGEPTCRAISAETMKMPEPIIDPATIIVESSRPRPFTNCGPLAILLPRYHETEQASL